MPASLTYDDIRLVGRFEIIRKATRFDVAIVDTDGSDVNVVLASGAAMAEEVGAFAQRAFNEVNLSTAARAGGEVLDRFIWDRYQLVRQDAQGSVVTLSFSRTDASQPVTIPAGTVCSTVDGQTFETITTIVMGIGFTGPISTVAQSQITGDTSNVEANSITQIISSLTDSSVTVTNPDVAAGGFPEESDDEFAQRARDFFVNARRGTRQAIQNGCVTTPGVAQATVIEFLNDDLEPNFRVQATVADRNGQANAALASNVLARMDEFRALGVPVRVTSGTPQYVDITLEGITFEAGANTTRLIEQIRAQILNAINQLAPGQTLERSLIYSAARIGNTVFIPEDALVSPAGDLVPSESTATIRTTNSRISINGQVGS